jgi:hypothetical protein
MSIHRFAPALLAFALILGACGGAADSNGETDTTEAPAAAAPDVDTDLADVTNYELTMDRVDRYFNATINVGRAMQGMTPAERAAFEGPDEEEMPSLDDMADRISSHPAVERAVRDAGLTPREYGTIAMSMLQAAMAQAFSAMQPNADPDSLARAAGANPANVAFMRDNAEALGQRQQEVAAAMEEYGITDAE